MAIVIEEEDKKKTNIGPIIGWIVILVIIGLAAYYIFFVTPEAVNVALPPDISIAPVSQFGATPQSVMQNPSFQALKQSSITLPTAQGPATIGRSNPFVSP